jgi:hypothetical protein
MGEALPICRGLPERRDDDMPAAALASEIGKLVRSVENEAEGETAATFPGLNAVRAAIGDVKTLKVQLE